MVTDQQVRFLFDFVMRHEIPIAAAAGKAAMSETTARKNVRLGKLPSETE